jgi:hypothetical protein
MRVFLIFSHSSDISFGEIDVTPVRFADNLVRLINDGGMLDTLVSLILRVSR